MRLIPELSRNTMWRATTANGDTQFFNLKIIAEDWAGPGGKVEAEPLQQQSIACAQYPAQQN